MSRQTVCTAGQPGSASMAVDRARGRYSDELRGTQRAKGVRRGQYAGAVKKGGNMRGQSRSQLVAIETIISRVVSEPGHEQPTCRPGGRW